MNPAKNWLVVREVISSTEDGTSVMLSLPELVRRLVDEKAWRDFVAPNPIGPVHHDTFGEFIRDSPPRGLDGRVDQMLALCGSDEELTKKVRSLLYGEIPAAPHGEVRGRTIAERNNRIGGLNPIVPNTAEYLVARLKRDDPLLAEKVVNGEVSPYRAQQEKGWRPPRIYVSSPDRVARSLLKYMSADDIAKLITMLVGDPGDGTT